MSQRGAPSETCSVSDVYKTDYDSRHPLYHTWHRMYNGTTVSGSSRWEKYGARGIRLHRPWYQFSVFAEHWEAQGWFEGCNIRRKDLKGDLTPDNLYPQ